MPPGTFMRQVHDRGRLIVGVADDTLLFGYLNPFTNQIEGFDIDVAREVARAIFGDPNRIELRVIAYDQRLPLLENGTVDMVADTMTINCARWQRIAFSSIYYQAGQKLLVRKDSTARGIEDMHGKKVCAAAGSTSIDNVKTAASHPVPVSVSDWTDCLVLFQQGKVDGISTDDTILAGLAAQDPYAKVVGPAFTSEPYGLGINRAHVDFVRFVNGVLDGMRSDGTWTALYNKWVGKLFGPAPPPPAPTYKG
jgi:polar amino acid transport system substrate-binding protein